VQFKIWRGGDTVENMELEMEDAMTEEATNIIGNLVEKSQILASEINAKLNRTQAEVDFQLALSALVAMILKTTQEAIENGFK
jgi:hypothetical protein